MKSPLTNRHKVVSIPNPIDTEKYQPKNKLLAKKEFDLPTERKIILFAAAKASDKRKGIDDLIEASRLLQDKKVTFLIAGTNAEAITEQLAVPFKNVGYIAPDKMPEVYNAADVFVTPSLQENLPNTIMEAMACGTPCVGFHIGGIPEMIAHKTTGYVAEYKNAQDLADGIAWCLFEADEEMLSANAREKVLSEYTNEKIATHYLSVYGK